METPKKTLGRSGRATDIVEHGRRFAPRRAATPIPRTERTPGVNSALTIPSISPEPISAVVSESSSEGAPALIGKLGDVARPKQKMQRKVSAVKPAIPRQHRSLVLKRQIVEKALKQQHIQRKHKQKRIKVYAMCAGVTTVVCVSLLVIFPIGRSGVSDDQAAVSGALGAVTSQAAPIVLDETPVTLQMIDEHVVPDDQPRVLIYQKLGIRSRIKPVGQSINKEPIAPTNIFDVGWLKSSPAPGTNGAALLNGNVVGPTQNGVLRVLGRAAVGDLIHVEFGDGSMRTFSVAQVVHYDADKVDFRALGESADSARAGLNIISMQGRFNAKTNQFEQRTAVFAVQVER